MRPLLISVSLGGGDRVGTVAFLHAPVALLPTLGPLMSAGGMSFSPMECLPSLHFLMFQTLILLLLFHTVYPK